MDRRRDRAAGAPGLELVQHLLCAAETKGWRRGTEDGWIDEETEGNRNGNQKEFNQF